MRPINAFASACFLIATSWLHAVEPTAPPAIAPVQALPPAPVDGVAWNGKTIYPVGESAAAVTDVLDQWSAAVGAGIVADARFRLLLERPPLLIHVVARAVVAGHTCTRLVLYNQGPDPVAPADILAILPRHLISAVVATEFMPGARLLVRAGNPQMVDVVWMATPAGGELTAGTPIISAGSRADVHILEPVAMGDPQSPQPVKIQARSITDFAGSTKPFNAAMTGVVSTATNPETQRIQIDVTSITLQVHGTAITCPAKGYVVSMADGIAGLPARKSAAGLAVPANSQAVVIFVDPVTSGPPAATK